MLGMGDDEMANWKEITREADAAKSLLLKNRSSGEEAFLKLIEEYPKDGMIRFQRGKGYEELKEYALAIKDYRFAEDLFPKKLYQEDARQARLRVEALLSSPSKPKEADSVLENIPEKIALAIRHAIQFLDSGEPEKAVTEIGQDGVRNLIMHLERENKISPQNNWASRTRELEGKGVITNIVRHQLDMVREIRNKIDNSLDISITDLDARSCIETFKAALIKIFEKK